MNSDFTIRNRGQLSLIGPISEAASEWLDEHIPRDTQWWQWGAEIAVDPRYLRRVLDSILESGLTVGSAP
jgi:hypothetical protein